MGHDYIVWDKAAAIQFLKPGRGTVALLDRIAFDVKRDDLPDLCFESNAGYQAWSNRLPGEWESGRGVQFV